MGFPHGRGFNGFAILSQIVEGLVVILCIAVIVGLLVLLVRFLLVATKAAELYVARNGAPVARADVVPDAPVETALATEPPVTQQPTTTTRPTSARTRTTKTPPSV